MLGRAGVILAAAVLSLGTGAAGGDTGGGGLWDPHGASAPAEPGGGLTAAGRAAMGTCELAGADRARTPSMRCLACHDGGSGPSAGFSMGPGGDGMSHPVEVDYARVAALHPDRYAPAESLPREVPLVRGLVSCTTCHDGASSDPKRVAVPARLCQACHRM